MTITVKLDDGTILYSNGADATQIFNWWAAAEAFARQHGMQYAGPGLKRTTCIDCPVQTVPGTEIIVKG
jgi:hypothetical protein